MPGPHRKMVTQEESATVSEGEGEGVARESGRSETGGRVDGDVLGAPGGRGERRRPHSRAQWRPDVASTLGVVSCLFVGRSHATHEQGQASKNCTLKLKPALSVGTHKRRRDIS